MYYHMSEMADFVESVLVIGGGSWFPIEISQEDRTMMASVS